MKHNFSQFIEGNTDQILEKFLNKYTSCMSTYDEDKISKISNYYKKILTSLDGEFKSKEVLKIFEQVAKYKISMNLPYVLIVNDIYGLKNILISNITKENINSTLINLLAFFDEIGNKVAAVYLKEYIKTILSVNNIRINSLADVGDKKSIVYYEAHLLWLSKLANAIKNNKTKDFSELDETKCNFGKWLLKDGKKTIQNNSKLKTITSLHDNLHLIAKKMLDHLRYNESHVLLTYLEKCEFISLSIGTELALIDNMLINKQISKDTLTGAVNRRGLKSIFMSQYELSLATNNSFILVMCDLDYFKKVNDTYGHIAGDKVLILFVNTVKKQIRNSDIIIRYGGEEFIIILPAIDKNKGFEVLENIRKKFQKSCVKLEGKEIKTTFSAGLVEIHPDKYYKKHFLDEYITIADQKLYHAKSNGRNKIEF